MKWKNYIRIFGIYSALAFIITILITWWSWEIAGFTYFKAGEPNTALRYFEYCLGIISISVLFYELKQNYKLLGESNEA